MAITYPPQECGRGGLMSFGRMPASLIPEICHLSLKTRELRPATVVTHGGHVPGIWDVSGRPL